MASDSSLALALWVGPPARVTLADGTQQDLEPNVSICEIGADEAQASENWKPLTKKQADAHRAAAATDDGDDA